MKKLCLMFLFTLSTVTSLHATTKEASFQKVERALLQAAFKGDLTKVRTLTESGVEILATDSDSPTPLLFAATQGRAPVVQYLLQYMEKENKLADSQVACQAAYITATQLGKADCAKLIRDACETLSNPHQPPFNWQHYAKSFDPKFALELNIKFIAQHAQTLSNVAPDECGPLAQLQGQKIINQGYFLVDQPIEQKQSPFKGFKGLTPLMIAAVVHCMPSVRLCLDLSHNVNQMSNKGATPLLSCLHSDQWFKPTKPGSSYFFDSEKQLRTLQSTDNLIDITKLLLQNGANVALHSSNSSQQAPLHLAVTHKTHPQEVAALLLRSGAQIDARDVDQNTPLMRVASKRDNDEMVRLLSAQGATVNARNNQRQTVCNTRHNQS